MKLRNKKTGEIFDAIIREKGGCGSYSLIVCDIKAYEQSKSTPDAMHFVLEEYDSLAKLNDDWEDYAPAEPLIKDEKARKVFREWVELFNAGCFQMVHCYNCGRGKTTAIRSTDLSTEPVIELPGHIGEESETYTRNELIGEEEE